MRDRQETFIEKLHECNQHKKRLLSAKNRLKKLMPLDINEELGLVDREKWMSLRKERNEIAHEYSFNQDEVIDGINLIFERVDELLEIYSVFCLYSFEKFDFVQKSGWVKCQEDQE